ncbi:HNH endonuclease [Gorillibacterium sp. sgz5001074]|uniref:HNH endonuclease n=1 Tax=Gorillibacterium sp. sgz5001074 TaxID=3446695 RepID=UPI003F67D7FF
MENEAPTITKTCSRCNREKPLSHFMRRSGRRSGNGSRRGICRACRKKSKNQAAPPEMAVPPNPAPEEALDTALPPRLLVKRPLPKAPPKPEGPDPSILRPTKEGIVRMRGITDKGRRWYQETDLETAVVLVKEYAAVVVNPHTIRRIYSNKKFRKYILTRDHYTCHFCGEYGDTIDHLLPRSKGGHTTPLNCVCACNLCNQSKADRSLDEFLPDTPGELPSSNA